MSEFLANTQIESMTKREELQNMGLYVGALGVTGVISVLRFGVEGNAGGTLVSGAWAAACGVISARYFYRSARVDNDTEPFVAELNIQEPQNLHESLPLA